MANQEQRQRFINTFVYSVYIYNSHAVITFNYRDVAKTVSLAEVEATGVGSSLSLFAA